MKRIIKAISIGLVFCLALCFVVPDVDAFAKKSSSSSSSSSKSNSSSSSSSSKSNSSSSSSGKNSGSNSSGSKNNNSSGSGSKNSNSSSSSGSSSSSNKSNNSSSSKKKDPTPTPAPVHEHCFNYCVGPNTYACSCGATTVITDVNQQTQYVDSSGNVKEREDVAAGYTPPPAPTPIPTPSPTPTPRPSSGGNSGGSSSGGSGSSSSGSGGGTYTPTHIHSCQEVYLSVGSNTHNVYNQCTGTGCNYRTFLRCDPCVWNSNHKCSKCGNQQTGKACQSGTCYDSGTTYSPCGCSGGGGIGGCSLSINASVDKNGNASASKTGCAWHMAHASSVYQTLKKTAETSCAKGEHKVRYQYDYTAWVTCSECSGVSVHKDALSDWTSGLSGEKRYSDWTDKNNSKHERTVEQKCSLCNQWVPLPEKETASHDKSAKEEVIASNWTYNSDQHWHVKKTTKMCSVCGHKFETTQSEVNKGNHNFKKTNGSWVANADGYYYRTNTSVCQTCGYTKTEDERGEKVHTHIWVSTSGSWYDYDSTRHAGIKSGRGRGFYNHLFHF